MPKQGKKLTREMKIKLSRAGYNVKEWSWIKYDYESILLKNKITNKELLVRW